jgi:hypothetical protein
MPRLHVLAASLVGAATIAGLTGATPASRSPAPTLAAPEIVIAYGALLPEQRVIAGWHENHRLLLATRGAVPEGSVPLTRRPAVQLALFWGAGWRATAESPERLRGLRPEQASQHGTFYPATATAPAVLAVGSRLGIVSDSGLAVLRRHRVPVQILPE